MDREKILEAREKIFEAADLLAEAITPDPPKDAEEEAAIKAAQTLQVWCKNRECKTCIFRKVSGSLVDCELEYWKPRSWDILKGEMNNE